MCKNITEQSLTERDRLMDEMNRLVPSFVNDVIIHHLGLYCVSTFCDVIVSIEKPEASSLRFVLQPLTSLPFLDCIQVPITPVVDMTWM